MTENISFGQEVTIKPEALEEDLRYFPYGIFLYYNGDKAVVELLHSEIQVEVDRDNVKIRKKK